MTPNFCTRTARFLGMLVAVQVLVAGCSVRYYDTRTGTEHLWGIGHLKMKAPPPDEGVQAVVQGTGTLGLNLGAGSGEYYLGLGWDHRERIVVGTNASVRLERPRQWFFKDLFDVRVGSKPPFPADPVQPSEKPHPP